MILAANNEIDCSKREGALKLEVLLLLCSIINLLSSEIFSLHSLLLCLLADGEPL
jgi:hypothetical protein